MKTKNKIQRTKGTSVENITKRVNLLQEFTAKYEETIY
jgi:hypothetical protein